MNRLIVIGASGHGKVVADIAVLNGYEDIVFLDDDESLKECAGFPVIGKSTEAPGGEIFVAVGNPQTRKRLMELYKDRTQPVLIHPNAVVAKDVKIGSGTVVMAGAVINPGARIRRGIIVNTSSSIDHDCSVGDYSHVSVGAHLCGTVKVEDSVWIGAGATVINNVNICGGCTIGAGAVVIKDIKEPGTYVGVPAKMISKPNLTWGGYSLALSDQLSERRVA
jgi:sugar O-acyltransferase (sialic acid O-acetyltransferase NeuD family)